MNLALDEMSFHRHLESYNEEHNTELQYYDVLDMLEIAWRRYIELKIEIDGHYLEIDQIAQFLGCERTSLLHDWDELTS